MKSLRRRQQLAAKCLAGAQNALLVEGRVDAAVLWTLMAVVHLGALASTKQLDKLLEQMQSRG